MADDQIVPEYYKKQTMELDVPEGALHGVYHTRIANMNESKLLLEVPMVGNLFLPVKVGQLVTVRYVVESWAYEAPVAVADRRDNVPTPLMMTDRPALVTRRQIRKFLRVDTSITVSVHLISDLREYGREKYADHELTTGVIEDISGGGSRIRVPQEMVTDGKRYALLWFTLPLIHKSFYNMLTRIKSISENPPDKFMILEFTGLSESERNDIVQYCSRRQLELRKGQPG